MQDFLSHLAVQGNVAAATQNQAFNALVFLYKQVLERPLEGVQAARSRKEPRIPVVLTREEVKKVLALLEGTTKSLCLSPNAGYCESGKRSSKGFCKRSRMSAGNSSFKSSI